MATKYFCDVCGVEVSFPNSLKDLSIYSREAITLDNYTDFKKEICNDCSIKIKNFIKTLSKNDRAKMN